MVKICVFSGSNSGSERVYKQCAERLGYLIGSQSHELVYGGSRLGLMGDVAKNVQLAGGRVIGVIPEIFSQSAEGEDELIVTKDIAKRLETMESISDVFVALPGGIGSGLEIMYVTQNKQLKIHNKPLVLINTYGFYDNFANHWAHLVEKGFINPKDRDLVQYAQNPDVAFELLGFSITSK